jgi:hypothetical protein
MGAFARLEQGLGDGRDPAHAMLCEIRLVDADNGNRVLLAARIRIGDGRAEEDLIAVRLPLGRHDLGGFYSLGQETDPAIDLAQPALAVNVVAVLRAIPVARRPGDGLDELGAFDPHQLPELVLQTLKSPRRDVVLDAGRQQLRLVGQVVIDLGFFGESLAHPRFHSGFPSLPLQR